MSNEDLHFEDQLFWKSKLDMNLDSLLLELS